jgi:paraquat-inducible protein A
MDPELQKNTTARAGKTAPPASRSPHDRLLGLLLVVSAALLVAGWFMPVMTVRTLMIFYDEVSIVEGILRLIDSGDYLLTAIILVFTIVFPVGKLILAFIVWWRLDRANDKLGRALHWVDLFSKWSMLDVFVVALIVVIVKISLISDVTIHAGLYIFCAAVVLSMLAVWRITRLAHRETGSQ